MSGDSLERAVRFREVQTARDWLDAKYKDNIYHHWDSIDAAGIVFGIAYISRARELEILRDRMGRIQRSRDSVVDRQISRTASLGEAWLR
jgi:hypothetical protein